MWHRLRELPRRVDALAKPGLEMKLHPDVLRWARERTGYDADTLASKVGVKPERVTEWRRRAALRWRRPATSLTHTYTPEGYLYLEDPPEDWLPIARPAHARTANPSGAPAPICSTPSTSCKLAKSGCGGTNSSGRRHHCRSSAHSRTGARPEEVAGGIRETLGMESGWASQRPNWSDALRFLRDRARKPECWSSSTASSATTPTVSWTG